METLTAKKMAETIGISINLAGKYLRGYCRPKLIRAIEIERKLGIPVEAWDDIKSYLNNNASNTETSRTNESKNIPKAEKC